MGSGSIHRHTGIDDIMPACNTPLLMHQARYPAAAAVIAALAVPTATVETSIDMSCFVRSGKMENDRCDNVANASTCSS